MPAWILQFNQLATFLSVGCFIAAYICWRHHTKGLEELTRELMKDNLRLREKIEEIRSTINFPKQ